MSEPGGINTRDATDLSEGFKMTELGPLPEEWRVVRLEEITAKCFSGVWGNSPEESEEDEGQVLAKVIRVSDIKSGSRIAYHEVPVRVVKTKQLQKYRLKRGDIIVVKSSGSKSRIISGRSAIFEPPNNVETFIPSNFTLALRIDSQVSDPYFVWYYLLTRQSKEWVDHVVEGSTYPNLKKAEYLMMPIPLPPLPEQRAIAYVLRTVQEAREATERVIAALKELKKSLLRHLFTYGPVPVDQADQVPLKETEIGPMPEHWKGVRLGPLLRVTQYGLSIRAKPAGKYPMLRMNNLIDGRIDTLDLKYVDLNPKDLLKFKLHKGDVLFNRTNSYGLVGKTAIFDKEGVFVFASYLIRIVPEPTQLTPRYLNYYLNWEKAQHRLKAVASRGVSQSNISATKLKQFEIALPPLSEQHEIARILQAVDCKIEAEENRKQALDDLFRSLLHHLMTAKLRVSKELVDRFEKEEVL